MEARYHALLPLDYTYAAMADSRRRLFNAPEIDARHLVATESIYCNTILSADEKISLAAEHAKIIISKPRYEKNTIIALVKAHAQGRLAIALHYYCRHAIMYYTYYNIRKALPLPTRDIGKWPGSRASRGGLSRAPRNSEPPSLMRASKIPGRRRRRQRHQPLRRISMMIHDMLSLTAWTKPHI